MVDCMVAVVFVISSSQQKKQEQQHLFHYIQLTQKYVHQKHTHIYNVHVQSFVSLKKIRVRQSVRY